MLMAGGLTLSAQDFDFFVRSMSADGRVQVIAEDGEWLTRLSTWSERSLEQLEREWKRGIPFRTDEPIQLRMTSDSTQIRLAQLAGERRLGQRIFIPANPEDVYALPLAERFVEAMLTRIQWSTGSLPEGQVTAPTPVWTRGVAASLLQEESSRLAALALERFRKKVPPSPELVDGSDDVDSFLLYRWIQHRLLRDSETARIFWERFQLRPDFEMTDWVDVTPRVSTLRELHMAWEVWWMAERQRLISEFRLVGHAREQLLIELNPVPRFFGLGGTDPHALAPAAFENYQTYREDPGLEQALMQWVFRLQSIRFRLPQEMNTDIKAFEQALLEAIKGERASGASADVHWRSAVARWNEALASLSFSE